MIHGNRPPVRSAMNQVVSADSESLVLWDSETGDIHNKCHFQIKQVIFSKIGLVAFLIDGEGDVLCLQFDPELKYQKSTLTKLCKFARTLSCNSIGSIVAGGSMGFSVVDVSGGDLIFEQSSSERVECLQFSADDSLLACSSWDGIITIWNSSDWSAYCSLRDHGTVAWSICFSPTGDRLAVGSNRPDVIVYDIHTGSVSLRCCGHRSAVLTVCYSRDGGLLASGSIDKTVRVWDAYTGEALHTLTGPEDVVTCLSFQSDVSHLVSGSYDKTVRVWDLTSGSQSMSFCGHAQSITLSYYWMAEQGSYI